MLNEEQKEWLTLSMIPGVGTVNFIRLLARFHSPGHILNASEGSLREIIGPKTAQQIVQYRSVIDIHTQLKLMEKSRVRLITLEDSAYPSRLAEIYDPPMVLFVRGDLLPQDECCVAIVGTRHATPYGIRMAEKFGRELAMRGITVVSGMADGIDSAAHRGALNAGGRTIAVLGNGVDVVYPAGNARLMEEIVQQGCVLSQYAMGLKPTRGSFPYRNRIISGLTLGTLIVEAPLQSGALITARMAMDQGREVFAIPGTIDSANSQGPHTLIRNGAALVEKVEDILEELNLSNPKIVPPVLPSSQEAHQLEQQHLSAPPSAAPVLPLIIDLPKPPPVSPKPSIPPSRPITTPAPAAPTLPEPSVSLSVNEKNVFAYLTANGSHVDEIALVCKLPISETLSALTLLELKGLARQYSGKRFARV